jgi:hypothetical protein
MALSIRSVEYWNVTVRDRPGAAYEVLSQLAAANVSLLAFSAVPIGVEYAQLVLFPDNVKALAKAAEQRGLALVGPNRALLVQGDDKLGAFAEIHRKLSEAQINVYASNGVTDGRDGFGYVVYVRPEDFDRAARVLGL